MRRILTFVLVFALGTSSGYLLTSAQKTHLFYTIDTQAIDHAIQREVMLKAIASPKKTDAMAVEKQLRAKLANVIQNISKSLNSPPIFQKQAVFAGAYGDLTLETLRQLELLPLTKQDPV